MSDTPPGAGTPPTTPPPAADWRASLPDDLKADPSLTTISDVATLAKSYVATKSLVGRKGYELPQQDWTPEKYKEWGKINGVPESPDKYAPVDNAIMEKAGMPPEVMSAATKKFHEFQILPWQAKGLMDWYLGDTVKGRDLIEAKSAEDRTAGESALRGEFKDDYDAKLGLMKAFFTQANTPPSIFEKIDKAGLGSDPEFVKWAVRNGERLMESSARGGQQSNLGPTASREVAKMEIEQMKGDKDAMRKFFDGNKETIARWEHLHKIANQKQ